MAENVCVNHGQSFNFSEVLYCNFYGKKSFWRLGTSENLIFEIVLGQNVTYLKIERERERNRQLYTYHE
jgi:hypothetical protein